MTINVMWRDSANVYVVADSAVTTEGHEGDSGPTSFCQFDRFRGRVVQEGFLKIYDILGCLLLAACGDADLCEKFVAEFRRYWRVGADPVPLMASLGGTISVSHTGNRYFEILMGYIDSDGPHVLNWSSNNHDVVYEGDALVRGNVPIDMARAMEVSVCNTKQPYEPQDVLSGQQAYLALQCMQYRDSTGGMLDRGIGGPMVGAILTPSGVQWQRDTLYMLCTDHILDCFGQEDASKRRQAFDDWMLTLVACGVRESVFLAASCHLDPDNRWQMRLFMNSTSLPLHVWLARNQGVRAARELITKPSLVVFLHKYRRNVFAIRNVSESPPRMQIVECHDRLNFFINEGLVPEIREDLLKDHDADAYVVFRG